MKLKRSGETFNETKNRKDEGSATMCVVFGGAVWLLADWRVVEYSSDGYE